MAAGAAVKGVGGKKGRSGRKSKAEELGIQTLLDKAFTFEDRRAVIANLSRIARGHDDKAAVSASSLLLAYAYGRPTEKHEHSGEAGGPIALRVVYVDSRKGDDRNSPASTS